ncbi:cytochrome P450 2M1 isoform X2 [Esox lucius]|uniref:cytochrome P450 2M1 isoform X2 n=1 Tax=Esox lucius TaxID=8010 RepID=UPI0010BD30CC|nr:cytochrome P450 2M1 isoform X2 [Esox lucius]
MDLLYILQTNFIPIILGLVTVILLWKNQRGQSHSRLPPGPAPIPLFGNLLQMDVKAPYKLYMKLSKKYGSVFTVWLGSTPVVVVSGYQAIKEAFVNQGEEFSGRANYPVIMTISQGYGVLVSSGKRWKDLRRMSLMTLKNFGMGRRTIEQRIQEETKFLIEAIHEYGDSVVNPKKMICNSIGNVISSIVFGHRFEYNDPMFQLIQKAVNDYFNVLSSPIGAMFNMFPRIVWWFPGKHHRMFAIINQAKDYMRAQAELRLKNLDTSDPQDLLEAFLIKMLEEKDDPNTEFCYDNMVMTAWNLFSAGTETTSSTLRQSFLMMMKYPSIQGKVQKEIDDVIGSRVPTVDDRVKMPYTDAVLHEVQRFMDLAPTSVPHKVIRDTEFHNYLIPEGTMVLPLFSSVLSDPELFKNPDEFDPENFLDENGCFKKNDGFLPFGLGKRVCLGEALARMELFLFFTSLLQRFTFSGTQPPEEINVDPECASFGRIPQSYECYIKVRTVE